MNYGELEKKTFKTFLVFATILVIAVLILFIITSNIYRVFNITYDESLDLNYSSIESLRGTSIWLIDDTYFQTFYEQNPSVEKIVIEKKLPRTIIVKVNTSEKLAYIQDNRQSPPKTFILHKNLHKLAAERNEGLLALTINNGPVVEGFFEEVITLVMTLKKYPVNLGNIVVSFDGLDVELVHFKSQFNLGSPYDLARKAAVLGYYLSEEPCEGEVRLVYNENGSEISAITNCN